MRRRPPLLSALGAQALAAILVFGTDRAFGIGLPLPALLAGQGGVAAALGHVFGLARWWLFLNFVLPQLAGIALTLVLPGWIYPLAFLLLALVFWNSADDRVPLYLTNRTTWAALAGLLPERGGIAFVDLGSGLGGTVLDLARRRPDCRFLGVESAPLPFLWSRLRLALSGCANAEIRRRDMWREDLSQFDVVYCFLSPEPMPALWDKTRREMRPGSLLISNSFEVPGHPADRIVTVDDRRRTRLHVWQV